MFCILSGTWLGGGAGVWTPKLCQGHPLHFGHWIRKLHVSNFIMRAVTSFYKCSKSTRVCVYRGSAPDPQEGLHLDPSGELPSLNPWKLASVVIKSHYVPSLCCWYQTVIWSARITRGRGDSPPPLRLSVPILYNGLPFGASVSFPHYFFLIRPLVICTDTHATVD